MTGAEAESCDLKLETIRFVISLINDYHFSLIVKDFKIIKYFAFDASNFETINGSQNLF